MNSVPHVSATRPDWREPSQPAPSLDAVPLERLLEEMLGVSGDDDPIHRVVCELEELTRVVSTALVEENHSESSVAFMAYNRARVAVALYERRLRNRAVPTDTSNTIDRENLAGYVDEALENLALACAAFAYADGATGMGFDRAEAEDREGFNVAVAHVAASLRCIRAALGPATKSEVPAPPLPSESGVTRLAQSVERLRQANDGVRYIRAVDAIGRARVRVEALLASSKLSKRLRAQYMDVLADLAAASEHVADVAREALDVAPSGPRTEDRADAAAEE